MHDVWVKKITGSYNNNVNVQVNMARISTFTRGDQKVHEKVLLYHIAFIDCNKNSQIETTIYSKLTEIKI